MNSCAHFYNEINIKNYEKGKIINNGCFGTVYEVEDKSTGQLYGAEIINCRDDEDQCKKIITNELIILMCANHPTIMKYIGYSKKDFEGKSNIIIIMELSQNGSLADIIRGIIQNNIPANYSNTSRQIILAGVARGMKYLHKHGIIHRYLKPDNIFLDKDFHPKISNFGFSKITDFDHSKSEIYEAPEILKNERYDYKIDVYAFGILMYEVVTDSFAGNSDSDLKAKILNESYRPKFEVNVKEPIQKLIEECWSDDPKDRPSFDEIFDKIATKSDYFLDGVDENEFKTYVDEITGETDTTENMLKVIFSDGDEIHKLQKIIDNLADQNDRVIKENEELKEKNTLLENDKNEQLKKIQALEEEIRQLQTERNKNKAVNNNNNNNNNNVDSNDQKENSSKSINNDNNSNDGEIRVPSFDLSNQKDDENRSKTPSSSPSSLVFVKPGVDINSVGVKNILNQPARPVISIPKITMDITPGVTGTVGVTNLNLPKVPLKKRSFSAVYSPPPLITRELQDNSGASKEAMPQNPLQVMAEAAAAMNMTNTKEVPKSSFAMQSVPPPSQGHRTMTRRRSNAASLLPGEQNKQQQNQQQNQAISEFIKNEDGEYEYTYDYEESIDCELEIEEEKRNLEILEKHMEGNSSYTLHVVILYQWKRMINPPKFASDGNFPCQVFPLFATILHTKLLKSENVNSQQMMSQHQRNFDKCLQVFITDMSKMPTTRDELFLNCVLIILLIRTQAAKYKLDAKRCEAAMKTIFQVLETTLYLILEKSLDKTEVYVELFSEANFDQTKLLNGFHEIFEANKSAFKFGEVINEFLITRFTELVEEKMLNRIIAKTDKFTFGNAIKWNSFLIALEKENNIHMKIIHQAVSSFIIIESIAKTPILSTEVCPDISPSLISFFITHLKCDEHIQNLPKPAKFNKEYKLNKAPRTFELVPIKKTALNISIVYQRFTLNNWNNLRHDEPNVNIFSFLAKYIKENEQKYL